MVTTASTAEASVPPAAESNAALAAAINGSEFDRGNIISDENFFNPNAMSAAQVQSFIDSKVTCAIGAVCLANLRIDTFTIPATPMCSTYQGGSQETAAMIIYKVGLACGISQAVLLVTLQKEQGLVTSPAPSTYELSAAMGAGCYDNGQPCIDQYAGFFNQVFNGAYLLKRYTQPTGTGPGTPYTSRYDQAYPVGQTSNILVSTLNCGTIPVYVSNQATHSLYLYTPYTPNAAALANLGGTGDVCSSYGNRNFWYFYYSWFGNPLQPISPIGWFDGVSAVGTTVTASGWAVDGRTSNALDIQLSVDGGAITTHPANVAYPGLGNVFSYAGDNHGFSAQQVVSPGQHTFCVTVVNNANNTSRGIGCKVLTVASSNTPIGWLDRVYVAAGQVTAEGWALDYDTAAPISVSVSIDGGTPLTKAASNTYPGLGEARPGFGDNHGFSVSAPISSGSHTVCVTAINDSGSPDRLIGCRNLTVPVSSVPIGWLDRVFVLAGQVTAQGWAVDYDTFAPISIRVSVDGGSSQTFTASNSYPGLGNAKPGFGDNHGFSAAIPVPDGTHTVCVTAINDAGALNRELGCSTVTVATSTVPIGWLDSVNITYQQATVAGWTIDYDTAAPISINVTVDGSIVGSAVASNPYAGLGSAKPGFGDNHGFSTTVTVPVGIHSVCVTAINDSGPSNREIGCRTVTSTSEPPIGWLDSVSALGPMVTASGWAFDPDVIGSISVKVSVDGVTSGPFAAGNIYAGLGSAYPGRGDAHGFSATVTVPVGNHAICVIALNNDQGADRQLGCLAVTVVAANVPIGWLDSFTASGSTVTAAGWAIDPDTTAPIALQLSVDGGAPQLFTAGNAYPNLGLSFPGFGDNHGFSASLAIPQGVHTVCVAAINDVPGVDRVLNCTSFSIS